MKITSAEANKLLRKINAEKASLLSKENSCSVFPAALEEDIESIRPEYDFAETTKELNHLNRKIRDIKHALNIFNSTTELPGTGMTIDQVLVELPMLNERLKTLSRMKDRLPKQRRQDAYGSRAMHIEYDIANYDNKEAAKEYEKVSERISSLQLALDLVNASETFEADI